MAKKLSQEAEKARSLLIDYKAVFRTPEGERVMKDLMANNYILGNIFDKDPMVMAFRAGERQAILSILDKLGMDPEEFAKTYDEQYGDES